MTTRCFEYLDRHSHPNMAVSQAVLASSAIPLVFLPQAVGDALYVDGFFQANMPIAAFPGKPALAFHLSSKSGDEVRPDRRTVSTHIGDILDMLMNSAQRKHGVNFESFTEGGVVKNSLLSNSGDVNILTIDCGEHGVLETRL